VAVISGIDYLGRTFGRTTENILIRNFTITNANNGAMSIGSEMSAGVRNVTFIDIFANGTGCGPRIKAARGRGGINPGPLT
jgi:polygalacturonase